MTTTPTSRFKDAVNTLYANGHGSLADAAWAYYDQQCRWMSADQRDQVLAMFDEVLIKELGTTDPIHPTEFFLSPDFAFLKALARTLQELELNYEDVEIIELTVEEVAAA